MGPPPPLPARDKVCERFVKGHGFSRAAKSLFLLPERAPAREEFTLRTPKHLSF